ncbi:MAG: hypothetical protein ACUVX1_16110 [Chloroflexota bacterium]
MSRQSSARGLPRPVERAMLILLDLIAFHQVVVRLIRRCWHFPAPPFMSAYLDSPLRKALQPPEMVRRQLPQNKRVDSDDAHNH